MNGRLRRGRRRDAWGDLLFAWRVCKHVSSNAIVLASGLQTIGIGAGQMSRVDAVRIAVEKARELGHDPRGAVLACDAFFPFADGPQLALDAGVTSDRPAGRLKRDDEVIAAVEAAGRGDGLHRPPPLPALASTARRRIGAMTCTALRDPLRWKALAVVCAAFFMTVLDVSIVNVALPSIGRGLHFSQRQPAVGDHRLRDHVRRLPAARRPRGRPARAARVSSSSASSSSPSRRSSAGSPGRKAC